MKMRYLFVLTALAAGIALFAAFPASASVTFGNLYLDDEVVGTVINPGNVPDGSGTAPLYVVMNGAEGQLGVAGLGPGDHDYRGGRWAFHAVHFNDGVEPYLLTSGEAVMDAEDAGDVTVMRVEENDFRCPITN